MHLSFENDPNQKEKAPPGAAVSASAEIQGSRIGSAQGQADAEKAEEKISLLSLPENLIAASRMLFQTEKTYRPSRIRRLFRATERRLQRFGLLQGF